MYPHRDASGVCALLVNCRSAAARPCLRSKLAGDQLAVNELWGIEKPRACINPKCGVVVCGVGGLRN